MAPEWHRAKRGWRPRWRLLAWLCLGLQAPFAAAALEDECATAVALEVRDVRISSATPIRPDPTWRPAGAPRGLAGDAVVPFCRVEGVIEEEIGFELWLPPRAEWNGRFLGVGNGGDAGFINYLELGRGVGRGFATASTDTGHKRSDPHWALGRPDRLDNYGHRAHHVLARTAKALIAGYYGTAASYAYFSGCSGGGLQGMNEVQRYPGDYDGVLAGASGRSMVGISARWLISGLLAEREPQARVTAAQWRSVADAAVRQCDGLDGVTDGVIDDPRRCEFDPASVADLTPAQAERVGTLTAPLTTGDGEVLFEGFEPGIAFAPLDSPAGVPARSFGEWTYQDPDWDPRRFDLVRDLTASEARVPGLRVDNPALGAFRRAGGRLITYVGWLDPIVPARENIAYFESVRRHMGTDAVDEFFRLYVVPGLGHCRGGPGAVAFGQPYAGDAPEVDADHDLLSAIVRWVEEGVAPDEIIGSRVMEDGDVDMTRPICPYPSVVRYDGTGDPSAAASFTCEVPR